MNYLIYLVQWLPTLSKVHLTDLQTNHERYVSLLLFSLETYNSKFQIAIILEQLYPTVSLRDKINNFIDNHLFSHNVNDADEATSSGFVFIRRFPGFNEKIIDKYNDLMNMGLANTLNQCKMI